VKSSIGAVILAGGKNERMGADKARLPWRDGKTFLENMIGRLLHVDELLISVSAEHAYDDLIRGLPVVVDRRPGRGPISGVHSALLACRSDWLLVVPCDMPLFEKKLADYLMSKVSDEYSVILAATRDGFVHPLCGLYSKRAAEVLDKFCASGNNCIFDAVRESGFLPIALADTPFPDEILSNVNTPEEYVRLVCRDRRPPIVAVCGAKRSGKTSLIAALISELARLGLRVAAIKHDGHDFTPDTPGTDSFRMKTAGAIGTAVYSANRWMMVKDAHGTTVGQMADHFSDADLILLEGGKTFHCPKIEVVRDGASPICDPASLLAICGSGGTCEENVEKIPVYSPNDIEGLASLIANSICRGQN